MNINGDLLRKEVNEVVERISQEKLSMKITTGYFLLVVGKEAYNALLLYFSVSTLARVFDMVVIEVDEVGLYFKVFQLAKEA